MNAFQSKNLAIVNIFGFTMGRMDRPGNWTKTRGILLKPGVHTRDCACLRRKSTVANKPVHDWTAYTVTTISRPGDSLKPPDRYDRQYLRAHSQAEVTPQKAFSPENARAFANAGLCCLPLGALQCALGNNLVSCQ